MPFLRPTSVQIDAALCCLTLLKCAVLLLVESQALSRLDAISLAGHGTPRTRHSCVPLSVVSIAGHTIQISVISFRSLLVSPVCSLSFSVFSPLLSVGLLESLVGTKQDWLSRAMQWKHGVIHYLFTILCHRTIGNTAVLLPLLPVNKYTVSAAGHFVSIYHTSVFVMTPSTSS